METTECINSRRSIRKYKNEIISKDDILKIINSAAMAPSGGNAQPWKFIVVQNQETIQKIRSLIYEESARLKLNMDRLNRFGLLFNAPNIIAACAKIENPAMNFEQFLSSVEMQSASAAIQNILLSAHDSGYGTCWCKVPPFLRAGIETILSVERPYYLIANIAMGVPDEKPPPPARKNIDEICEIIR